MEFIKFSKGKQKEFVKKVKEKSHLSWPNLAKIVNKSRSTLLAYLREDCKIPKIVFNKLSSKYNLKANNIEIISLKNTKKKIRLPKLSNNLSEFLGAIAGDGHLHDYPAELSITCHKILDKEYINYLQTLFQTLFHQKPTIIYQNNTVKLRFYSKELVEFLNQKYNLPIGKKKNRLYFPKQVLNKKSYLISFIRGLYDTDGTINRHHKNSGGIIEISSRDKQFLEEINKKLIDLGFKTSLGYKGVKIYKKDEILRFFKIIKPSNPKHNLKYEIFKKGGLIPLTKDIMRR